MASEKNATRGMPGDSAGGKSDGAYGGVGKERENIGQINRLFWRCSFWVDKLSVQAGFVHKTDCFRGAVGMNTGPLRFPLLQARAACGG
jgi:hypothetical protein